MPKAKDEKFNLSELKKCFDGIQSTLNQIRNSVMAAAAEINKMPVKPAVVKPVKPVKLVKAVEQKAVSKPVTVVKKAVSKPVTVAKPAVKKAYTPVKIDGQTFVSASSAATYLLKTTTFSQSEIARRLGVTATLVCQLAKAAKTA